MKQHFQKNNHSLMPLSLIEAMAIIFLKRYIADYHLMTLCWYYLFHKIDSYDNAERLTQVRDNLGNKVDYTYDSNDNRLSASTQHNSQSDGQSKGRVR